jgi:hypothetical protein
MRIDCDSLTSGNATLTTNTSDDAEDTMTGARCLVNVSLVLYSGLCRLLLGLAVLYPQVSTALTHRNGFCACTSSSSSSSSSSPSRVPPRRLLSQVWGCYRALCLLLGLKNLIKVPIEYATGIDDKARTGGYIAEQLVEGLYLTGIAVFVSASFRRRVHQWLRHLVAEGEHANAAAISALVGSKPASLVLETAKVISATALSCPLRPFLVLPIGTPLEPP